MTSTTSGATGHHRGTRACIILWPYVEAHDRDGLVGSLRFYRNGATHLFDSHPGVHQGDPLGSVLFTLAIHDRLKARYPHLRVRRLGEVTQVAS